MAVAAFLYRSFYFVGSFAKVPKTGKIVDLVKSFQK